jgi:hypothetical protein
MRKHTANILVGIALTLGLVGASAVLAHAATTTTRHITRTNLVIGSGKHAQKWACHYPHVSHGKLIGTHCIPVISVPGNTPSPSPTPVSYPSDNFVLCYPNYSVWIYGGTFKDMTGGNYELRNGTPPPWTEELSGYNQGVC